MFTKGRNAKGKKNLREKTGKEDWRPRQKPQKFAREVVFFLPCLSEKCQNPKAQLPSKKTQKVHNFPPKKAQQKAQKRTTFRLKEHNFPAKKITTAIRKKTPPI